MVIPSIGDVVTILFPFSDLSNAKLRPAIILAESGKGDWILAQITSKAYADVKAISLTSSDFVRGTLKVESYIRPGKLFTANKIIFHSKEGVVSKDKLNETIEGVVQLFHGSVS